MSEADGDSSHTKLYALLHVSRDAPAEEIRKAYRKWAQAYHPDKYQNLQMKETAKENFQRICEAYQVLSNESKRKIYDIYGMEGLTSGLELGTRQNRVDEIIEELEKMRPRMHEDQAFANLRPSGTILANLSLPHFVNGDGIMRGMSMSSEVSSQLSRSNLISISGNMASMGNSGDGAASAVLKHQISSYSSVEFMASAGLRALIVGAQTSRYLSAHSSATTGLALSLRDGSLNLSNSWARQLSETSFGNIELTLGVESSVSVGWKREEKKMSAAGELKFGTSSFGASAHYTHCLTSSTHFHVAGKVGSTALELELGGGRKLSKFSTLRILYSIGIRGVFWKLELYRAGQKLVIPILIFRHLSPLSASGAFIIPTSVYFLLQKLILKPYLRGREKQKKLETRAATFARVKEARTAAENAQQLLHNVADKKRRTQEETGGLIIVKAVYGNQKALSKTPQQSAEADDEADSQVIDVTLPLNFLVNDSGELKLHGGVKKSGIMGFCDPCPGEMKQLQVEYVWKGQAYEVIVDDCEELFIPRDEHKIP